MHLCSTDHSSKATSLLVHIYVMIMVSPPVLRDILESASQYSRELGGEGERLSTSLLSFWAGNGWKSHQKFS